MAMKSPEGQSSEPFRHEKMTGFGYLQVRKDRVKEQEESGGDIWRERVRQRLACGKRVRCCDW